MFSVILGWDTKEFWLRTVSHEKNIEDPIWPKPGAFMLCQSYTLLVCHAELYKHKVVSFISRNGCQLKDCMFICQHIWCEY